jgi:hypothetical protein
MLYQLSRTVIGAETTSGRSEAVAALGYASPPSNEQILQASKKAYSQYQPAVDALTLALVNLINTGSQLAAITTLDGINWTSPGIGAKVAEPIFACPDVMGAMGAARSYPDLNSLSVGVFSKDLPGSGAGMVGFDRDLAGSTTGGLKLTLDIYKQIVSTDPGANLQLGMWLGAAGTLYDKVIGFYVNTEVHGVSVNLKMLLSTGARPVRLCGQHGSNGPGFNRGICRCDSHMAVTRA